MKMIEVLNRRFERVAIIDNETESGLHFTNDKLKTTIEGGVYTLDMDVLKTSPQHIHVVEGAYITFINRQGVRCLLTIMQMEENKHRKKIYCEDTSINLINKIVGEDMPEQPQTIEEYMKRALEATGWRVGKNEIPNEKKKLELQSTETLLSRVRNITQAFGVEFYFEANLNKNGLPDFRIHLVKERVEGSRGFRISSDDALEGITRKINIDNLATKVFVVGKESTVSTDGTNAEIQQNKAVSAKDLYQQPSANKYDASKQSGATAVRTSGWDVGWVNRFRMDSADPPYVNGSYIDAFLRSYYPDSPLIGHGTTIKLYADYFGVSVGAALGVWAKETTFGRASCGGRYNFGCIRWTASSGFNNKNGWIDPPNVEQGIAYWFRLVRYGYINSGQATYQSFLDKYSPTFENDHSTFKNLMWGVLKSFGYDTSDTIRKKNYSNESDNARTLNLTKRVQQSSTGQPQGKSPHEQQIDKMIQWFYDRQKGKRGAPQYSMTSARTGPNYYDCSSAVYAALKYAGFKTKISWLGSTVTLWEEIGALLEEIPRNQAKHGDIFLSGPRGAASAGSTGHTGVFVSNSRIIHMNYADNGITETPVSGRAGSPLYCFRIRPQRSTSPAAGSQPNPATNDNPNGAVSAKHERAVQRALSRVGKTPYVWSGESISGWDCSGMIYEVYRYAGFPINHRCTTGTISAQQRPFKRISRNEAKRGDLAITNGGGHVEILLGPPGSGAGIVHAADERLGTITQPNHVGGALGYYRVEG